METQVAEPTFVYSPDYYCDVGDHVFRTEKYEILHDRIVSSGLADADGFLTPAPATREQLELVHTPQYVSDLLSHRHTERTVLSEMPISPQIVNAFVLAAGGTVLACREAVSGGSMAMNLSGGFHHAFPDWAEGFCYINDVAIGVSAALSEELVERAMVVDCDLHQGNGTARIFHDDPRVFTFSIHQENVYPIKQESDLDVGLPDYCSGAAYCEELSRWFVPALERHEPELALFVAGADPYERDTLGSLQLSMQHLRRRDDIVIGSCADRGTPVAVVLAGGYAPDVRETVEVHYGTACSLAKHCAGMQPTDME